MERTQALVLRRFGTSGFCHEDTKTRRILGFGTFVPSLLIDLSATNSGTYESRLLPDNFVVSPPCAFANHPSRRGVNGQGIRDVHSSRSLASVRARSGLTTAVEGGGTIRHRHADRYAPEAPPSRSQSACASLKNCCARC